MTILIGLLVLMRSTEDFFRHSYKEARRARSPVVYGTVLVEIRSEMYSTYVLCSFVLLYVRTYVSTVCSTKVGRILQEVFVYVICMYVRTYAA